MDCLLDAQRLVVATERSIAVGQVILGGEQAINVTRPGAHEHRDQALKHPESGFDVVCGSEGGPEEPQSLGPTVILLRAAQVPGVATRKGRVGAAATTRR